MRPVARELPEPAKGHSKIQDSGSPRNRWQAIVLCSRQFPQAVRLSRLTQVTRLMGSADRWLNRQFSRRRGRPIEEGLAPGVRAAALHLLTEGPSRSVTIEATARLAETSRTATYRRWG